MLAMRSTLLIGRNAVQHSSRLSHLGKQNCRLNITQSYRLNTVHTLTSTLKYITSPSLLTRQYATTKYDNDFWENRKVNRSSSYSEEDEIRHGEEWRRGGSSVVRDPTDPFCTMEVVILGTNSGIPTPDRSCSSSLLRLNNGSTWLFDCGEGIQVQVQKSTVRYSSIDKVFITHLHGDHVYGLPGFLIGLHRIRDEPVHVYGPPGLRKFIRTTAAISNAKIGKVFIHEIVSEDNKEHYDTPNRGETDISSEDQKIWKVYEDEKFLVQCAVLRHTINCFGYVVTEKAGPRALDPLKLKEAGIRPGPYYAEIKSGAVKNVKLPDGSEVPSSSFLSSKRRAARKVVILGDTSNSNSLIKISDGAELVLHESTLDEEDRDLSFKRGHSTPAMAARFAKAINAKRLVLTHFGASGNETEHNEKVSRMVNVARKGFSNEIIAAKDLMRIGIPISIEDTRDEQPIKTTESDKHPNNQHKETKRIDHKNKKKSSLFE